MHVSVPDDHARKWLNRPSGIRLFMRASDLVLDDAGNCRQARIEMLDLLHEGPVWRRWNIGQKAHFHPFKVALLDTKRAGLHLASEWRRGLSGELKFASAYSVREAGYFVINPSNVACLAEPFSMAMEDPLEARYVRANLCGRFGVPEVYKPWLIDRLPRLPDEKDEELLAHEEALAALRMPG